jgi:quercetin dioxygenase-like cupin family protein
MEHFVFVSLWCHQRQKLPRAPAVRGLEGRNRSLIKTAEINQRLLEDVPVIRMPKFVPPGGGLSIWWMGDDKITFQATSADTDGAYAFWLDEPPGHVGPPKHVHSREEEGFYVIEGQVQFRAGHIDKLLTKDDFIALPKGIPHSWTNTTAGNARLITFTAGAGNEGFFLTLGASGVGPARPRATLPLEEINARTRRYGVTYMESTADPLDGALQIGAGRSPTVVRPEEGQRRHACGVVYSVKACGSITANAYTLIEVLIAPGGIMPSHRHAAFEEGVYVLDGSIRATLDGETYEAPPDSFLIIPWGLPHEIRNMEGSSARLLLLSVPGGIEDYYRAACAPFASGRDQEDRETDLARLRATGARFGVFE